MAERMLLYKGPGALSFHGRAHQREWLAGAFVNALFALVIGVLSSIGPLLALPWLLAILAVTARRLHDIDHSGWWQLVPMSGIGIHLAYTALKDVYTFNVGQPWINIMAAVPIISILALLAMWVMLFIVPGNLEANVYGEVD